MTNKGSFSPAALPAASLLSLPYYAYHQYNTHLFRAKTYLGGLCRRDMNLSALQKSFSLYIEKMVGKQVSLQLAVISGITAFSSPDTALKVKLCLCFNLSSRPSEAQKSVNSWLFARLRAFSLMIIPLVGCIASLLHQFHLYCLLSSTFSDSSSLTRFIGFKYFSCFKSMWKWYSSLQIFLCDTFLHTFSFFNFLQSFIFFCYRNVYSLHLSHWFQHTSLFIEDTNFV